MWLYKIKHEWTYIWLKRFVGPICFWLIKHTGDYFNEEMQLNIFFFMWADVYKSFVLTCYKCTRYFCLFYFDKDIYNLRATKRHAAEIERIKAHDTDTGVNTQTSVQWHWYTLKRETTRACILLKYADICATLLGITENLYHNVKKYKWLLIF